MKYAFIDAHQTVFKVSRMCRVFGVSRSGFYDWLNRPESARQQADRQLQTEIEQAFAKSRQTYGKRRLQRDLRDAGKPASRARMGRLMRDVGLRCKTRKQFKATTNSKHHLPVAPNRLDRQFQVAEPDRIYVGDITYVATGEGWLYLGGVFGPVLAPSSGLGDGGADDRRLSRQRPADGLRAAQTPGNGLFHLGK